MKFKALRSLLMKSEIAVIRAVRQGVGKVQDSIGYIRHGPGYMVHGPATPCNSLRSQSFAGATHLPFPDLLCAGGNSSSSKENVSSASHVRATGGAHRIDAVYGICQGTCASTPTSPGARPVTVRPSSSAIKPSASSVTYCGG